MKEFEYEWTLTRVHKGRPTKPGHIFLLVTKSVASKLGKDKYTNFHQIPVGMSVAEQREIAQYLWLKVVHNYKLRELTAEEKAILGIDESVKS